MAAPSSLQDIALYTIIRKLWKTSQLLSVYAEYVHELQKQPGIIDESIYGVIDLVEKGMADIRYLPRKLLARWHISWEELSQELGNFACEIGNKRQSLKDIKFCMDRIHLTLDGFIDKKQTLLNILKDSKFQIPLDPKLLETYGIDAGILNHIFNKYFNNVAKQVNGRKSKSKTKKYNSSDVKKRLNAYIAKMNDIHQHWDSVWLTREDEDDSRFWNANILQYLAGKRQHEGLKYCYEKCTTPARKQHELQRIAKFVLLIRSRDVNTFVFLYKNMDEDKWNELLQDHFVTIFSNFIFSWRYRSLCIPFFKVIVPSLTVKSYKAIFNELYSGIAAWNADKFQYDDVVSILKNIWSYTPDDIKQDDEFVDCIIPRLILFQISLDCTVTNIEFESMAYFMNSFSFEKQRSLFSQIVLKLIYTGNENMIEKCIQSVCHPDIKFDNYKSMLNKEDVKKYISFVDKQHFVESNNLDLIIKLVTNSEHNEKLFKEELLGDQSFMLEPCIKFLICEDKRLIWWLLNFDEQKLNEFKENFLSQTWIYESWAKKVAQTQDSTVVMAEILCKIKHKEVAVKSIKNHRYLVSQLFIQLIDINTIDFFDDTWEIYCKLFFSNFSEEKMFMEKLINSEQGKNAILGLFLNLHNIECDISLRYFYPDVLEYFVAFKKYCLDKNELVETVDRWLDDYGHPNRNRSSKIMWRSQDREILPHEQKSARKVVDAYFRCFKAMLKMVFTTRYLILSDQADLTDYSLQMARKAGVSIPVII